MARVGDPNYMERHDGEHRPLINRGPVDKDNARQDMQQILEPLHDLRCSVIKQK